MVAGNVRQWLDESSIDYFTHFVKAWIPFNAWYRQQYDTIDHERDILEQVKSDGNRMRGRIKARLTAEGAEAEELRNHIAALHRRLATDPLADRRGHAISLESVCVGRNPTLTGSQLRRGWSYCVTRSGKPKQVACLVKDKSGVERTNFVQPGEWNIEAFQLLPEVTALDMHKRPVLLDCYQQVNPYVFKSLLADSGEKDHIMMDVYRFINDDAAIFAGLVDVLYGMRNLLFHGELTPDPEANRTYEPAYHLLRHFLAVIA